MLKNKNTKNCWLFSKPHIFGHLIPIEEQWYPHFSFWYNDVILYGW